MFIIWNWVCFFFGGVFFDVIMKYVFGYSYWDFFSMIKMLVVRFLGMVMIEVLKYRNWSF